jgi:putative ABC transport system substrate-binding protein
MRRREFITLLGGAAAASSGLGPLPAHAQPLRRVGVLSPLTKDDPEDRLRFGALEDGLKGLGWTEGRNVRFDYRWYDGEITLARTLAMELIELRPDVIVVAATPGAVALRQETRTIPIVFVTVSDPIGLGLAESLARPGGNATGSTYFEFSVGGKLVEALKQAAPGLARVAVVYNPQTTVYALYLDSIQSAASALRMEVMPAPVRGPAEIEAALNTVAGETAGGVICLPDTFLMTHRQQIIGLAARHKLPALYTNRAFAVDGGLLSYGVDITDLHRRAANYVDRILKGANPAELPVQQPAKYELVINLKTARAMGLTIPLNLQVTADEVIE